MIHQRRLLWSAGIDMTREIRAHLEQVILPSGKGLRDDENGGFCSYVGYDLTRDFGAEKGASSTAASCGSSPRRLWR